MRTRELRIAGAWEFTPEVHDDNRGSFLETYRHESLTQVAGRALDLRQANLSVSRLGVLRGIHYASVPPGQAKYISAPNGAFLDFVIDLRVGSSTFGKWDSVVIDDITRKSVYLSEGLGHAVVALSDSAVLSYLVSAVYSPEREFTIDPFDAEIALDLPPVVDRSLVSARDLEAPGLREAAAAGLLPTIDQAHAVAGPKATS